MEEILKMDKLDRLLMEEETGNKRKKAPKKRIGSSKVYQQTQKQRYITSPSKKYASYSRGLNKPYGAGALKSPNKNGRSPQRTVKNNLIKQSYQADIERRSSSMNQSKFKSGKLRSKVDYRSPQGRNVAKKKDSSMYDFTKKLDSRAANRGGSSARGHRTVGKSKKSSSKVRVPSHMGKRPRGYIGKKTFLGRMEI
jgi:hypothetical protein